MELTKHQESLLKDYLNKQENHLTDAMFEILVNGRKETHWCWYFLPNMQGLGTSQMSKHFALELDTYIAFLKNQKFRRNIFMMIKAVDYAYRNSKHMDIEYIFGDNPVDVLKWKSCLTLTFYAYNNSSGVMSEDWNEVLDIIRYTATTYGWCSETVKKYSGMDSLNVSGD